MKIPRPPSRSSRAKGSDGGVPAYRHIAASLRAAIEEGQLSPGDRLPAMRSLADDLGVNRDTVALAYETLAREGWVETAVGRGTFVLARAAESTAPPAPLAGTVERLLDFEARRPRYGATANAIALHSLIPDPAYYPVDEFRRAMTRALSESGAELLLYGAPQGHLGLRERLAARLAADGIEVSADQVLLCHGASQGIALAVRLFAEAGQAIAVEEPTYHNVLSTLVGLGITAVPVPMGPLGRGGPDQDALERVLARPDVRAFYTIPTFHNPLGSSATLAERRAVLEVCARAGKPIIEDGFETDLRYAGRPVPPLAALAGGEGVVHLSSFSKSLFPGLRVGALIARGRAVEGLLALKHASDLSDSPPIQAALDEFLRDGAYDRHLSRMRKRLLARRDAALEALEAHMPEGTVWSEPEGGYQIWVELPGRVDTRDLLADAAREGVLFASGSHFFVDGRASRGMRLTFAQADEAEIAEGIERLGRVVRQRSESDPAARERARVHL